MSNTQSVNKKNTIVNNSFLNAFYRLFNDAMSGK